MRFIAAALCLGLISCSQEPAKQGPATPPAQAAGPRYAITLNAPTQLSTPDGSPIRIEATSDGLVLRNHVANPSPQIKTDGASVALGAVNEAAFAGHRVRVVLRAKGLNGATEFTSVYSTNGNGNSGWRRMRVSDAFQDVPFEFEVPALGRRGDDFIGINPPDHGAVAIQSITVEISPADLRP